TSRPGGRAVIRQPLSQRIRFATGRRAHRDPPSPEGEVAGPADGEGRMAGDSESPAPTTAPPGPTHVAAGARPRGSLILIDARLAGRPHLGLAVQRARWRLAARPAPAPTAPLLP